jgi:hypothetical protein
MKWPWTRRIEKIESTTNQLRGDIRASGGGIFATLDRLERELKNLQEAHDLLFDAVAEDLGYEAVKDFPHEPKVSPRSPAMKHTPPQVIRNKKAKSKC